MNIDIRQATPLDVGALMALVQTCIKWMRGRGIDQWDEMYPDRATVERDVQDDAAFVATSDRVIVGMAVLNEHQDSEYAEVPWIFFGRAAVIHRLMVDPTTEGVGVARNLMTFLERRAEARGFESIRLDAFVKNSRAVRFYDRSGYRRAGQVRFRKGDFYCFEKHIGRAG